MVDLIPNSFSRTPRFPSCWDEDDDWGLLTSSGNGLAISEDDKNVYVEAAVPGIDPKEIEVTFDKGVVWIKGEAQDEEKERKFYRRDSRSFSYRVMVPGDINTNVEPTAEYKNGVMHITFAKSPKSQPKKITVKTEN